MNVKLPWIAAAMRLTRSIIAGLFLSVCLCSALGAMEGNIRSDYAEKFFRERVQPIFIQHCYECHGNGKHKGGLSMATLPELLEGGNEAIVLYPGDVEKSPLITAIRWEAHDTELNMPPEKKMSEAEITDLTHWVAIGAPWPVNDTPIAALPAVPAPEKPPFVGRLHPIVVHFPIACLLLAVIAETLVLLRGAMWRPLIMFLVLIGTAASIAAVITGSWLAGDETPALERHELLGWITLIGALVSSGLLWIHSRWILRVALVATAIAAGIAGHLGGVMVYGSNWFSL